MAKASMRQGARSLTDQSREGGPVRVSVIVPAYNAQAYVGNAIRSAQVQSEPRIEILVVDDCSSDHTADIVRRIAEHDRRVRLIQRKVNAGPAAARNAGFEQAAGKWVALLDADDTYASSRLETLLAFGEERGADIVSDNILLCPDGDTAAGEPMIPPSLLPEPQLLTAAEFIRRNVATRNHPRVRYGFMHPIMRKDFLSAEGLWYDEHIRFGEDFLLYTQCLVHNAQWWILPQAMYLYSVREDTLTSIQTSHDLDRIRSVETDLLLQPSIVADRELTRALRRHKRIIDRCYYYRSFTDAVKARRLAGASKILFEGPQSIGHIILESIIQAPTITGKALRGGYARR